MYAGMNIVTTQNHKRATSLTLRGWTGMALCPRQGNQEEAEVWEPGRGRRGARELHLGGSCQSGEALGGADKNLDPRGWPPIFLE